MSGKGKGDTHNSLRVAVDRIGPNRGGVSVALNIDIIVPAIENAFGVQFMPADVYYISDVPSQLNWPDVWRIGSVAFLLSFAATLYPAWRASRTQPAEALRYE